MRHRSRLLTLAAPLLLLGCGGTDEATEQTDDTPLPAEATRADEDGLPNPDVEPAPGAEPDTAAPSPETPPPATTPTTTDDPPPEVVPESTLPEDAGAAEAPPTDSVDEPPPPEEDGPVEPMASQP